MFAQVTKWKREHRANLFYRLSVPSSVCVELADWSGCSNAAKVTPMKEIPLITNHIQRRFPVDPTRFFGDVPLEVC
jgi:hypothetical protein